MHPCTVKIGTIFPSPDGMSLTKLSLDGNNFGDGKMAKLFFAVSGTQTALPRQLEPGQLVSRQLVPRQLIMCDICN